MPKKKYCYVLSEEDMWDLIKIVNQIDESRLSPFGHRDAMILGTPMWELLEELSVNMIDYKDGNNSYKPNDVIFRKILEE
jgi:hypothetical protein